MIKQSIKAFFFILFSLLFVAGFAQKASIDEIKQVNKNFRIEHQIKSTEYRIIPLVSYSDTLAFVFNYPHAFVVISADKSLPPIKAYSTENDFPSNNLNPQTDISFRQILIDDYRNFAKYNTSKSVYIKQNQKDWKQIYSPSTKDTKVQYGPWLESLYGQTKCKDENNKSINVTNLYTPHNYAVGCVAITFVELLQYFEWPRIGVGSHSYNDNKGSTTGLHSVRFDKKYYNWGLIKDKYYKVPSSTAERQELGNLAYHCAVSVDMDFEYNGATSNINRIPNAANKFFRYTAEHIYKTASNFWQRVDTNIVNGFPVQFAIYSSSGAGHAVVCDGIKPDVPSKQYYHLNMGWWGSSNAWYLIQNGFNAGGYSIITAAVVDMFPIPELEKPKLNADAETVELVWYYTSRMKADAYELQVKIGAQNWQTISDTLTGQTYDYKYTSTEEHRFRVRAKLLGKWNALAYSNNMTINIANELENSKSEDVKVYPTLTDNIISIEYYDLTNCSIEVFNSMGKCVMYLEKGSIENNKKTINLTTLSSGIYFIKVSGGQINETKKIFKN